MISLPKENSKKQLALPRKSFAIDSALHAACLISKRTPRAKEQGGYRSKPLGPKEQRPEKPPSSGARKMECLACQRRQKTPTANTTRRKKPQPGFGLVNQPIAPGSVEWKSASGQECIETEKNKHERRGTWNLNTVIELTDLIKETNASGEIVVLGGIHPILYKKQSEDPNISVNRCRIVYNAPQARTTQSGLNVHVLYNENSSAPETFQGARASRAVGALR